jgi:flagellar basal body-associated protein FliL
MTSLKKEENTSQSFDNSNESEDKEKAFFQKKNTKNKPNKHAWGKKVFIYFVTGTLILAGLSLYPFIRNSQKLVWIPKLKWFPIQNCKSIKLEPFIIPFREKGKFTYISLSISFELPNKELMDEMIDKNNWIRGIIYNILSDNIYALENVSSLMKLKQFIIKGVNNVLTAGKVDNAIITDFSTV